MLDKKLELETRLTNKLVYPVSFLAL